MAGKSTINITFKLDGDGKGFKDLAKDADGLKKVIQSTIEVSTDMKKSLVGWSMSVQGIEAVSEAVGQLNDVFQGVIAESGQFDKAMRQTNTMAGKAGEDFDKLKASVAGLAKEVPVARDLLAKGLYQTISNGVPEDNWIEFLNTSARSSVGGIADLEKVVTVTSTVIKNYGLAWSDAQAVQDKIQLTAKNGVTSFEQLAEALPRVTGSAANLGVTMDEMLAVFATATGVTGNTAEVSTQLAAVLSALTKPSSEAAKAAEAMGIQFDAAAVKSAGGLRNFLVALDTSITQYAAKTGQLKETIYANLFGSAESLRLLTSLTGKQADTFATNIDAMVNSAGTMDAAFGEAANTAEAFKQMLENNFAPLRDFIATVAGGAAPILDFSASAGMTMLSVTSLSKTLKANGLVMRANAKLTKLATWAIDKLTISTRTAGTAITATSRSVKVLKVALVSLSSIGAVLVLNALATALFSVSSATEEAAEKQKELAEATANRKKELEDISEATASNAQKEISALERLFKIAADETKSREDRAKAVRDMQREWPEHFKNLNAERINVDDLTTSYNNLRGSIVEAAKAKAAQSKIEANAVQQLDIELQLDDSEKALEKKTDAYNAAADKLKKARISRQQENEDLNFFQRAALGSEKVAPISTADVAVKKMQEEAAAALREMNEEQERNNDLRKRQGEIIEANARLEKIAAGTGTGTGTGTGKGKGAGAGTGGPKPPKWTEDAQNLKEIGENIDTLTVKLQTATVEEAAQINQQIAKWREKADVINNAGANIASAAAVNADASSLKDISSNIDTLNAQLQTATIEEAALINQQIAKWQEKADAIRNAGKVAERTTIKTGEGLAREWGAVKQINGAVSSVTNALQGNGTIWEKTIAVIDGFVALYSGIKTIVGVIQLMTGASAAHAATKGIEAAAETSEAGVRATTAGTNATASAAIITANKLEAASWKELAASEYMAAHAYIPFAGFGIAMGFTTAMMSAVTAAGIPMLAEGGVASGPTLALVGEYAGASNNPEVIAPLDKLQNLLAGTVSDGVGGKVKFEIQGRTLVGILNKESNISKRS